MALEFKSTKTFKFVIGFSALFISTMAATFSVTGVASLFSGYFLFVALMMSGLEFGKVVLASFLARYWKKVSIILRTYFVMALIILIAITSAGIFGFLSDGYQKTKGTYDVTEKEIVFIKQKIELFTKQKNAVDNRISSLSNARTGQESRLDSLYRRGQTTTAKNVEKYIAINNSELNELSIKSNVLSDSISKYTLNQLSKETSTSTGELGPLKYLASIFNTDMDSIVKWFIFMLIFVFDPLAVLLFVSLNVIMKNEQEGRLLEIPKPDKISIANKAKNLIEKFKKKRPAAEIIKIEESPVIEEIITEEVPTDTLKIEEPSIENPIITEVEYTNLPIPTETISENIPIAKEIIPEVKETLDLEKEHKFYHGDEEPKVEGFHTSNFSIERVHGKKSKDDENTKTY